MIEEAPGATLERVHVELARRLAAAHEALGAPRVLPVSALGARADRTARFLSTKAVGDRVLMDALGTRALVLRPSIVWTPGTRIVRKLVRLARIARFTGGVFPAPAGLLECRLQPILCDDLERAVLGELAGDTGGVLELAGRDVVRLGEPVGMAFRARGLRPRPIRLPGVFWSAAASLCPRLISRAELVLVGEDNVLGRSREAATRSFVGASAAEFFRLALSP